MLSSRGRSAERQPLEVANVKLPSPGSACILPEPLIDKLASTVVRRHPRHMFFLPHDNRQDFSERHDAPQREEPPRRPSRSCTDQAEIATFSSTPPPRQLDSGVVLGDVPDGGRRQCVPAQLDVGRPNERPGLQRRERVISLRSWTYTDPARHVALHRTYAVFHPRSRAADQRRPCTLIRARARGVVERASLLLGFLDAKGVCIIHTPWRSPRTLTVERTSLQLAVGTPKGCR